MPAMAVGPCHGFRLIHRVRQQAGSYGFVYCLDMSANAKPGVGARLPAMGVGLCHGFRLIQRVRQQAGSYRFVYCLDMLADANPV